jgi:drug/metabolite transporter (DMT)-like permease
MLLSKKYSDWMWFARSGSVTAIIGAVLAVRNILRLTREERIRIRNMNIVECFTQSELEDQERDSSATIIGVVLMVAGTLIWAYGDLLPRLWSH